MSRRLNAFVRLFLLVSVLNVLGSSSALEDLPPDSQSIANESHKGIGTNETEALTTHDKTRETVLQSRGVSVNFEFSKGKQNDEKPDSDSNAVIFKEDAVPGSADVNTDKDMSDQPTAESVSDSESEVQNKKSSKNNKSSVFSLQDIINSVMTPAISKVHAVSQVTNNSSDVNSSVVLNSTGVNGTSKIEKNKFLCMPRNASENITALVKIVNSSELIQTLNFKEVNSSGNCALVMFYAPWCMFCARTAPSYNAVARAFPLLMVLAVDAVHFNSLNARFGTVSVPNILLFHSSKAVVRFNQTDRSFHNLVEFVHKYTGLKPNTSIDISDDDLKGPLPSVPSDDPDKWLFICWLFIITFGGWVFANSQTGQNLWRTITSYGHEHIHID